MSGGAVVLLVALGGAVGSLLRWGLEGWVEAWGGGHVGTLLVNVLGCLIMGVLLTWRRLRSVPVWAPPLLGTGVLGGFTTFSGYAVWARVVPSAERTSALVHLGLTPVLCLAALAAGALLAGRVLGIPVRPHHGIPTPPSHGGAP
ncbi:hypothetical protein BJF81_12075 [Ornithinimicrobium sp. CNJ-824]|uniref:fluoride efflux transporter FluC n=1 Tax=Ornithinimicrobium sp. CNJ-824 TaxID=1904966 RepID=UPI00095C7DAC|nr:CrcB family protein [Ornithinimicrobium sp. CNJ-824]OLT22971.1 hypothetical protein BJF81_12075 [Ornithinimicrobium sp. CNJ-824]